MGVIGVSGTIDYNESRQSIVREYFTSLLHVGSAPVLLCLDMTDEEIADVFDRLDGLMLAGGNDIDPLCFGEEPIGGLEEVNPMRDASEMRFLREALKRDMPILAICRGVQMLNVTLGGTLYQDLATQRLANGAKAFQHSQTSPAHYASHSIQMTAPLSDIFASDTLLVNSRHHQALKDIPAELSVCATARDGVIEGVYMPEKPFVLGVQWHPERMDEAHRALFTAFAAACTEYRAAMSGGKA